MLRKLQKTILLKRFVILLSLAISGCNVKPPSVPICSEITPSKAYCINTLTSEEFVIDDTHPFEGKTYWEQRPTMLLMPVSSWVEIKAFIIKICKQTNKCSENISSWDRTVDAIDKQVAKKK